MASGEMSAKTSERGARGRRRSWPQAEKAKIIAETNEPGANIIEVARRHGMAPQQLYNWRRQVKSVKGTMPRPSNVTAFGSRQNAPAAPGAPEQPLGHGVIELAIDGIAVRVGAGADPDSIAAVVKALRRA